jgi:acetyl-CoA acyltransferase
MRDVYIISAVRTAIGKRDGFFKDTHPVDLAAPILREVTTRAKVQPEQVEDVILGCVTPVGEQGANIARTSLIQAGFPVHVPGVQINRMCGSSQQAVHFASQAIAAGDMELVIAGGVENMTRVTMGSDWPPEGIPGWPYDWVHQGISAEMVAEKWGLTRDELDDFSYHSHLKAGTAIDLGYFNKEILPLQVQVDGETLIARFDEGVRSDPNREKMWQLKPAFKEDGVVTAGNASQISDGASAVLIASGEAVKDYDLTPRARLVAQAVVGTDPVVMLTGPIPATQKVLQKAGLELADIDLIEINEAFASVVLAWKKELIPDMARVNVNGGAIANGHPLGASGTKLMATLLHEMERREVRYGLQTMCIGHGMATATIVERM